LTDFLIDVLSLIEKNNYMRSLFAKFICSNRKALAVAMLCVLVVKGLTFLGMSSVIAKYPDGQDQHAATSFLGLICDQVKNTEQPTGKQKIHKDCCILCSSVSRHDLAVIPTTLGDVVAVFMPQRKPEPINIIFTQQDVYLAYSSGLLSDWSATAPPVA
jgi:hypothetical protein